ncbi:CsoS2 family carboxysome shell protein [Allochromatium vinosum]|uniref:Carboxysome structural peptide CsoS2 n=1 Tax=Allochromatium vinosum (strain ATCC 17899 / DSM 180 / NBRC 103801 / NCIMB 10441 / D) TaxID=572477 RepID=D3RQ46_ALLVD|nr:CsoS2 family carboxysome shell protein [Allochromatium vinosum]ADC63657.1 putative carboxysome structural peptide CsoS2 [Allochromatium vinosum DSM 180]
MADQERQLTGRAASIAKRRAIANGGKTGRPNPESVTNTDSNTRRTKRGQVSEAVPMTLRERLSASEPAPAKPERNRRSVDMAEGRKRSMARRDQLTRGRPGYARPAPADQADLSGLVGREASIARRRAIAGLEPQAPCSERRRDDQATVTTDSSAPRPATERRATANPVNEKRQRNGRPRGGATLTKAPSRGRMLSMARRAALAGRGKTGVDSVSGRSSQAATTNLLRNAGVSSREIAKRVREERCEHGKCGESGPRPTGRARRSNGARPGDAPSKVGVSTTASGQTLTGTQVGRSRRTTGDETGACRQVTGTEYMGAEVFQELCGIGPAPAPNRQSAVTTTGGGQTLTGDQVGRSSKVTGDETGAGRQLTGTPYTAPGPEGAPPKVGQTQTLSGRTVTGSLIGRNTSLTGVESGDCQRVTGNEYLGFEHFDSVCKTRPEPVGTLKVGLDTTWRGQSVTGSLVSGTARVTGNETGRCEIVTGTTYLGAEQIASDCGPETARQTAERMPLGRSTPGFGLTGLQPGIGGAMTGDIKGACQPVTGTPYLGGDDLLATCGSEEFAALPGSDDFPQPLGGGQWGQFSIDTPARAAQSQPARRSVTGTHYDEEHSRITGPFNMGGNRVTGTEGFRARRAEERRESGPARPGSVMSPRPAKAIESTAAIEETVVESEPARPRITGEGLDGGLRITGNDWGRNERVTGTEGKSAHSRNPTRRGDAPVGAFAGARAFRDAQVQERERPQSETRVTGGSGGTERGALVTLSGGARG